MLWSRLLEAQYSFRLTLLSFIPSLPKHLCTDSGLTAGGVLTMHRLHNGLPHFPVPLGLRPPPPGLLIFATASRSSLLFFLAALCFPRLCPFSPPSHHFAQASWISPRLVALLQTSSINRGPPFLWSVSPASMIPGCNSTPTFCCYYC